MSDPFKVVKDFEAAICEYTGARFAVTVSSCTMALLLACKWHLSFRRPLIGDMRTTNLIEIPKRTYVGVPMSIMHAGGRPTFRDEDWLSSYRLEPLRVYDYARHFTSGMYHPGAMQCVSFHHTKHLAISTHGGAILLDDPDADAWLRKARFDGRTEGVAPRNDRFNVLGFHCYMTPPTAAEGLMRLAALPKHNAPIPNSDYPDLSTMEIFR